MIDFILHVLFTLHLSIHSTLPYGLRRTLEMSGAKNYSMKSAYLEWPPKFLRRWMYREVGAVMLLLFVCPACASVQEFEQQVANNPDDFRALYNVGVAAFKGDDLEKAQAAFTSLKPVCKADEWNALKCEQIFYNAGNTEIKLKKFEDAVKSFEQVLEYNPDNELARKKLEYAKKMLEEEQQKQQDQQQDQQDQEQQDQNQDQKDNEQDEQQSDSDTDKHNEKNQENNTSEQKESDPRDGQRDENKEEQQKPQGSEQDSQQDSGDQEEQAHGTDKADDQQQNGDQQQPELTEQEQRLMNALKKHDQDMSKEEMGQRMRQVAKGSAYAKNNW